MTETENRCPDCTNADDEDLIGVLTAISVTSRRLARKLIRLSRQNRPHERADTDSGGETYAT